MKRLVLALLFFLTLFCGQVFAIAPNQYVNDQAGVLNSSQLQELNDLTNNFQINTGNEIAVLIIPELKNETIESQAVKTFEEWGVGKKGKDNGVLLLVAVNDRKLRIEVGYGLEGVLTDLKSSQIIRDVITPELKNNNYFTGIQKGLAAIIQVISADSSNTVPESPPVSELSENLVSFIILIVYLLFVVISRTKSWWLGGVIGAALGIWYGTIVSVATFAIIGLIIDFILSLLGQNPVFMRVIHTLGRISSSSRSSGGGGGFGGFGGGRSGGGGSSGSW